MKDADLMEFADKHMRNGFYCVMIMKVLGCACSFCRSVGRCRLTEGFHGYPALAFNA